MKLAFFLALSITAIAISDASLTMERNSPIVPPLIKWGDRPNGDQLKRRRAMFYLLRSWGKRSSQVMPLYITTLSREFIDLVRNNERRPILPPMLTNQPIINNLEGKEKIF